MTDLDFESDQLLVLLTDALSAGPGSPAWHEALARLNDVGVTAGDDATLLLRAREHLESGKNFRTVRAGAGFSRKVMESLDAAPAAPTQRRSSRFFVLFSVGVLLLALAAVTMLLLRGTDEQAGEGAALINTVASVDFDEAIPPDWERIGGLTLSTSRNLLRPGDQGPADATGAGLGWRVPVPADSPFSFSANYRLGKADGDWVAQLFITDADTFNNSTALTPHELVWLCQGRNVAVIAPSGQVVAQQTLPADSRNVLPVRLTVNGARIVVEQGNRQLWAGDHELNPQRSRKLGLRFIKAGKNLADEIGFSRVRVNTRQGVELHP